MLVLTNTTRTAVYAAVAPNTSFPEVSCAPNARIKAKKMLLQMLSPEPQYESDVEPL